MLLSFIVDHPDPGALEHALHLLWSGCGGKVHIFGPLPRQQVSDGSSSYPQLMLVLLKHLWKEQTHTYRSWVTFSEEVCLEEQTISLVELNLQEQRRNFAKDNEFHRHESTQTFYLYSDGSSHFAN